MDDHLVGFAATVVERKLRRTLQLSPYVFPEADLHKENKGHCSG